MAYTMNDVAKLAGVAPSTVSRVLSKSPYISAETVQRVSAAVETLKYHRNVHARRLAVGRSDLFGLVISEIANPFFAEIIRFQSAAWERDFDVLLLNTEYNEKRRDAVVRKLIESDVRGVAIITSSIQDNIVPALTSEGIGIVFCSVMPAGRLVSSVAIDYERGILQAVEHVASLGHRRAAVIAGPKGNRTAATVEQALLRGLRQRGLHPKPVTHSEYHFDAGSSAVRQILAAKHTPTVIFCGSDLIAMGAMLALEAAGLSVPKDISVVGIDDLSFAFLARPPLTTVSVPREQLGLLSFQALEKMLKSKRGRGEEYLLETPLVVRQSSGAAPEVRPQQEGLPMRIATAGVN